MTRTRVVSLPAVAALAALAACSDTPAAPGAAPVTFTNPVHSQSFPDPGVLHEDGTFFAYGTNNASANVPLLTSTDLVRWTPAGDVLPSVGSWATSGNTWAPEVVRTDAGKYVLYYTARWNRADRQCIGAAVADNPRGPFTDPSPSPLVCQDDEGGSIDASPFRDDDGTLYLYWKNDGNHIGVPSHLYAQRPAPDGLSLTGSPTRLLTNDKPWQGAVVEAPEMLRHDGRLYLFYSGGAFDSDRYAVGYATCDGPIGPCHDAPENPILRSSPAAGRPGTLLPGDARRRQHLAALPRVAAGRHRQREPRPAAVARPGRLGRRPSRGARADRRSPADAADRFLADRPRHAPGRMRWSGGACSPVAMAASCGSSQGAMIFWTAGGV